MTGGAPGRQRWWRAVPGDRRFPPRSRQSAAVRLVMDRLNHHAYAADDDAAPRAAHTPHPPTTKRTGP
ncbi:hypothetical protein ACIP3D_25530 [Streptomyces longwoodensis]|uniref:hypothetical protein n=1 Tax=Streptomyces longwoodensis TaxID=68231 RepID=UPI003826796F